MNLAQMRLDFKPGEVFAEFIQILYNWVRSRLTIRSLSKTRILSSSGNSWGAKRPHAVSCPGETVKGRPILCSSLFMTQLYNIAMDSSLIAGVKDFDFIGQYCSGNKKYTSYYGNALSIRELCDYLQGGVLLMNLGRSSVALYLCPAKPDGFLRGGIVPYSPLFRFPSALRFDNIDKRCNLFRLPLSL